MTRIRAIADPVRYGFAVGRVRVLEGRLLGHTTFERLLDARDYDRQRRILADTVYADHLEGTATPDDVERALDASLVELYEDFLEHANLPDPIVAYFRTRHDFENLKARLKAEALGMEIDGLLTPLGSVSPEVFGGAAERLPSGVREAEARIKLTLSGDDDTVPPEMIDAAVDKEMFASLSTIANESKSEFVQHLVALEADLGNVRAFVRGRVRELPVADIERALVPGGVIPASTFVAYYRLPFEEGVNRLSTSRSLSLADPEAIADPARLDVALDALVAREIRAHRRTSIGPDPVVSYVLARRAEVTALRTIIIGTFSQVPVERLRERVRDVS
ncbi:MAG: V-type ATPase subunit [Coriobacteriia bacterium]|nr:V-type ATPase subunit [Coriobacteriia bacterium]